MRERVKQVVFIYCILIKSFKSNLLYKQNLIYKFKKLKFNFINNFLSFKLKNIPNLNLKIIFKFNL